MNHRVWAFVKANNAMLKVSTGAEAIDVHTVSLVESPLINM